MERARRDKHALVVYMRSRLGSGTSACVHMDVLPHTQLPAIWSVPDAPRDVVVDATRNVVPRARHLAKELGVDLAAVHGSGPGGRVLVEDVQRAADAAAVSIPDVPFTGIGRAIAQRMHGSLRDTAQFTLVTTADVSDLAEARSAMAAPRPSWTDVVVKGVALALKEHPPLNATADDRGITLHDDVHVGLAVALEDGLVVPVIRNVDTGISPTSPPRPAGW